MVLRILTYKENQALWLRLKPVSIRDVYSVFDIYYSTMTLRFYFNFSSVSDWLALGQIDGVQHPIPAVGFVPVSLQDVAKTKVGKSSLRYTSKANRKHMALNRKKKLETAKDKVQYLWLDVAVTK